jgi:hypothetical protein
MKSKVASAVLCAFLSVSALAQTSTAPPKSAGPGQQSGSETPGPPEQSSGSSQPGEGNSTIAPVLWVSSVEVMRSTHGPQLDVIRARGLSSTEGWEGGELVPFTEGPSSDGMLDLIFVAQAPSSPTRPAGFPEIEAVFTIEPGHPYKGVRVHSATNRITLKTIPGYSEAPPPPDDCSKCVGKYFVGKGESLPAGVSAADSVREENLPKSSNVIKGNNGIGKLDSDPNRLTLVLGDDGRIVIAVWD